MSQVLLTSLDPEALEAIMYAAIEKYHSRIPVPSPPASQAKQGADVLLETSEVIEKLKISPATLYNWRNQGKIPFYRLGRRVYYKEAEVMAALEDPRLLLNSLRPSISRRGKQ